MFLSLYVYVRILIILFLLSLLCPLHFRIFFFLCTGRKQIFPFFRRLPCYLLCFDVFFFVKWIKMMATRLFETLSQNKGDKILACHFIKISRRRTRVNHLLEVETVVKQETNESRHAARLINECGKLKILRPIFLNQDFFHILCFFVLMNVVNYYKLIYLLIIYYCKTQDFYLFYKLIFLMIFKKIIY